MNSKSSDSTGSDEEPAMTDENMRCEGHLDPPFPCENCRQRKEKGFDVPCLKTAKTVESLL